MKIIGRKPTELQKKIYNASMLESPYKFVVVSTGRQVAKTTTAILIALKWCEKKNFKVSYFMPSYKQCKKVFKQILNGLKTKATFNKSDLIIEFKNASTIQFFTAENDNCRGFTFEGLIVDEACFVKGDIWYNAILPTIAISLSNNKGKVVLLSTPKTKNWFYEMTLRDDKEFCFIKATSEEGGLYSKEVLELIKKSTPEHIFQNEYMAEFMESGNGIFNYKKCVVSKEDFNKFKSEHNVAGLDFGIENDYTALTIMNYKGELLYLKRWNQCDWMDILDEVAKILKKYNATCYAETNGIGNMPFKELKKKYINTKEWNTSAKSKIDIINKLSSDFKGELIKIPEIEYLLNELDAYTMEYNPSTGKVSYGARSGFNDDCVMSLAICNFNRINISNGLRFGEKRILK